jgi:hypothetical protein
MFMMILLMVLSVMIAAGIITAFFEVFARRTLRHRR